MFKLKKVHLVKDEKKQFRCYGLMNNEIKDREWEKISRTSLADNVDTNSVTYVTLTTKEEIEFKT